MAYPTLGFEGNLTINDYLDESSKAIPSVSAWAFSYLRF